MKPCHLMLLLLLLLLKAGSVSARDYAEPLGLINPLHGLQAADGAKETESGFRVGSGFYGQIWYEHAGYSSGGEDAFTLGTQGASRVLSWKDRLAVQVHLSSILVVGPVHTDEQAASIAEWWMNAVQYQYGLHAAVRSPFADIITGYRRTSLHPLRKGYSEIARDQIFIGLAEIGPVRSIPGLEAALLIRYSDLWDFWGSSLGKPRNWLTMELLFGFQHDLSKQSRLFIELQPRLHKNRTEPGYDIEPAGRVGMRLGTDQSGIELYLHGYHSIDTEQHAGRIYRTTVIGLGVSALNH